MEQIRDFVGQFPTDFVIVFCAAVLGLTMLFGGSYLLHKKRRNAAEQQPDEDLWEE